MTTISFPTNYHVLTASFVSPTDNKPARVKIASERFKQSVIIPYTNEPGASNPTRDTAIIFLQSIGFEITGQGEGKDKYYLISTTFEPLKKDKTKVAFYVEPENNTVLAVFPDDTEAAGYGCYSHVGQHSSCSETYIKTLKRATKAQANDLKKELEQIGYVFK